MSKKSYRMESKKEEAVIPVKDAIEDIATEPEESEAEEVTEAVLEDVLAPAVNESEIKALRAKRPILYDGRLFKAGESLPDCGKAKIDEWLNDGSAVWE